MHRLVVRKHRTVGRLDVIGERSKVGTPHLVDRGPPYDLAVQHRILRGLQARLDDAVVLSNVNRQPQSAGATTPLSGDGKRVPHAQSKYYPER